MNCYPPNPICGSPRPVSFVYWLVLVVVVTLTPGALAQWVEFDDQTELRSDAASALFADDP